MKTNTTVCAEFDSVGKPKHKKRVIDVEMRVMILEFAKWMQDVYMGSHIRLTIARGEAELNMHTQAGIKAVASEDMLAELEGLLSQDQLFDGDESEAA